MADWASRWWQWRFKSLSFPGNFPVNYEVARSFPIILQDIAYLLVTTDPLKVTKDSFKLQPITMAEDTPRKFVTLGMFIIDELVYDGGKTTKEQVSDRTSPN